MRNLKRVITSDPFTLQQLKDNVGILAAEVDNDSLLQRCLEDGIQATEQLTSRNISFAVLTDTVGESSGGTFTYYEADFNSIESVKDGVTDVPHKVKALSGSVSIEVEAGSYEALEIKFKVGYEAANVPRELRAPCLVKASNMFDFENSNYASGTSVNNNKSWENLCKNITIFRG